MIDSDKVQNFLKALNEVASRTRYEKECYTLAALASMQLNSEKNKNKPPIENMSFEEITTCISNELEEFIKEIFESVYAPYPPPCRGGKIEYKLKSNIKKQRVKEELGDLIAYCVGFLAKLEKEIP